MTQLEKDLEAKLRKEIQKRGGLCLKWVCPGWSGVPDRIVLLPGGHVYFVEMKRPKGGRLSAMQLWWNKTLERLGFDHWVIWDVNTLGGFLQYIEKETTT